MNDSQGQGGKRSKQLFSHAAGKFLLFKAKYFLLTLLLYEHFLFTCQAHFLGSFEIHFN